MEIFAIKDVYTGFADPVCFINRTLALDSFRQLCRELPRMDSVPYKVTDISLYALGSYDNDTGVITPILPTLVIDGSNFVKGDDSANVEMEQEIQTD